MRVDGVRRSLNAVKGKMDAFRVPDRNHLGIEFDRLIPAAEFDGAILPAVDTLFRHLRIELEGEPTHSDRLLPIKSGDGLFQPPFADVAPCRDGLRAQIKFNWPRTLPARHNSDCRSPLHAPFGFNAPSVASQPSNGDRRVQRPKAPTADFTPSMPTEAALIAKRGLEAVLRGLAAMPARSISHLDRRLAHCALGLTFGLDGLKGIKSGQGRAEQRGHVDAWATRQ
jgi:hypothetical protein